MKFRRNIERWELIQILIDKYGYKKYLEIGVQGGYSLLRIRCKNKMAVDPNFIINFTNKVKFYLKNTTNFNIKYFEQTSDDFFKYNEDYLKKLNGIDIVFVDGLHTFEASLKDVLNSLRYINKKGYIVVHDCLPLNDGAALETQDVPTPQEILKAKIWTNTWCGDVWKTIVYLRRVYKNELDVFVYNSDGGLGIVKIKGEINNFEIDYNILNEIKNLKYSDLINDTENLIGLTNNFLFY